MKTSLNGVLLYFGTIVPKYSKTAYIIFASAVFAGLGLAATALWNTASMEVIASYTTDLAPRSREQRHNITRAASAINGLRISPGEEFSFNRVVGRCGVEQGYQKAPAIVSGVMREEWGGGVCQVSSTLYNAALIANLKITQRQPHSRRVSSVPPGRDAAIAFGVSDLRFVNNTGSPIRILALASENRLTVSIEGKPGGLKVVIETDISRSRGMACAQVFRVISGSGAKYNRELISVDEYPVPDDAPGRMR